MDITKKIKNNCGFTLVELMIAVALIGILSVLAIAEYRKFTSISKQTEAKLALSGAYIAEKAFSAEFGTYSYCLSVLGYQPNGFEIQHQGTSRYYAIGFYDVNDEKYCGPNHNAICQAHSWQGPSVVLGCAAIDGVIHFNASSKANPNAVFMEDGSNPVKGGKITAPDKFTIFAAGSISTTTSNLDVWEIDQDKNLVNTRRNL